MEKLSLSILGSSKQIYDVEQESATFLRDPFTASKTDLIAYCLKELAETLHLAVVHTFYQLPTRKCGRFFLIGYRTKGTWSGYQQKIYGDPELCAEGTEIKWLLKNLRWYWRKYAQYMELNDDAFDDITGFLLFDVVQNAFADCEISARASMDVEFIQHCFEASLDLVIAISESSYYEAIAEGVLKNRHNLETMMPLISEFQIYQKKQERATNHPLDAKLVLEFLRSSDLIRQLEKEHKMGNCPVEKPLTNFFLYTVMPRFEYLSLNTNDKYNEGIDSGLHERSVDSAKKLENTLNENLMERSHLKVCSTPFNLTRDSRMDVVVPEPLTNQTMEGSMIVINHYESSPLTGITPIAGISEEEVSSEEEKSKGEGIDSTFVFI